MNLTSTIIIGAGQCGLAMSACLSARGLDHVVLERGEIANSWKTERWDSLRLLTPNWQSRLPGKTAAQSDPDDYRSMEDVAHFFDTYAASIDAPVRTQSRVTALRSIEGGYEVVTTRERWRCHAVVIASGACNVASIPALATGAPRHINQIDPLNYRNPAQLADGPVLVVGASATGVQLAQEIHASGRPVTIAVGEHVRMPRHYRERDIKWWMDAMGTLDTRWDEVSDLSRARNVPSMQIAGSHDHGMIDLNALQDSGVRVTGRLADLSESEAQFSGGLANVCALADLKMNRMLDAIDSWVSAVGLDADLPAPHRFPGTRIAPEPDLTLDLAPGGIRTIVWATGFKPDYSWLDIPVLDRRGRIRHDGGVTQQPGLYVMGLPFLRRRKSTLIDGAGDDARDISAHIAGYLSHSALAA